MHFHLPLSVHVTFRLYFMCALFPSEFYYAVFSSATLAGFGSGNDAEENFLIRFFLAHVIVAVSVGQSYPLCTEFMAFY